MLSARDVANYFLALASEEEGELISNLKLQKLVYYAQGFSLAIRGKPLFQESIEAWTHGPVVPSLYREFKEYGSAAVEPPSDFTFDSFDPEIQELLDEVYSVYGQYSASGLRTLTHSEPPWKDAPGGQVIPLATMRDYFKTLVNVED